LKNLREKRKNLREKRPESQISCDANNYLAKIWSENAN